MKKVLEKIVLILLLVAGLAYGYDKTEPMYWTSYDKCDQVVTSPHDVYSVCWSDEVGAPITGVSKIDASKMDLVNIAKRPNFKRNTDVSGWYKPSEINMPYQLGHTFGNDGDNDYSQDTLDDTYNMINITPQIHFLNQGMWKKIEKRGKELATQYNVVNSATIVDYVKNKFGYKVFPVLYTRVYFVNDVEECYQVKNKDLSKLSKDLSDYKINCNKIPRNLFTPINK